MVRLDDLCSNLPSLFSLPLPLFHLPLPEPPPSFLTLPFLIAPPSLPNNTASNQQLIVAEGGLAVLIPLLKSEDSEIVTAAVAALRNLSIHQGNEVGRLEMGAHLASACVYVSDCYCRDGGTGGPAEAGIGQREFRYSVPRSGYTQELGS